MTDDVISHLSRLQEQQAIAERVAATSLPRDDSDVDHVLSDRAAANIRAIAQEADIVVTAYRELREGVIAIRTEAAAGRITQADAVSRLAEAHRSYANPKSRADAVGVRYSHAQATHADPAAARARLVEKFPGLLQ